MSIARSQRHEPDGRNRYSPSDYLELAAVWNGTHPETGEPLVVEDMPPSGFPPFDLP